VNSAPEVILCQDYGLEVDMWYCISLNRSLDQKIMIVFNKTQILLLRSVGVIAYILYVTINELISYFNSTLYKFFNLIQNTQNVLTTVNPSLAGYKPFSEEASSLSIQAQIVSNLVQFPEEDWKDISESAKVGFVLFVFFSSLSLSLPPSLHSLQLF
jgi:hypothetical protein